MPHAFENVEPLGIGLHQPVFDAVVHHLDKMPRAGRPGMQVALLSVRLTLPAGRRALNRADAGGERLEDRVEPVDRPFVAPNHQAVTPLQAPHAAAGSHVDVVHTLGCQRLGAAHIVFEVGVAAVDDAVTRLEQLTQRGHRRLGDGAGRQHHPHGTGPAELLDQGHEVGTGVRALGAELLHRVGIGVVHRAAVTMAHQPPNNIPAHSAQTNHSKFHNVSLVDEFCQL